MRNISRRINTIEKLLGVGQHITPGQPLVILCVRSESKPTVDPESLGPVETWITYQKQLKAGQKANAEHLKENPFSLPKSLVIVLDADKELRAREGQGNEYKETS